MGKVKVNINKPDPSQEVIDSFKYANQFNKKQQEIHTYKGIRRLLHGRKNKLFYTLAILALIILMIILEVL